MSKGFSISLSGLQPILKKLKDTEDKVVNEIDIEISASTQLMATTAKQLAPVDTGRLKNSIGAERIKLLEHDIFCKVYYAPYIEFGTKSMVKVPKDLQEYAMQFKKSKGNSNVGGIRPKPFFFVAIKQHRKKMIDNIIKILREKRG